MIWLPFATVKAELDVVPKPSALAENCLLPAESTIRFVKLTNPLPAVAPMSPLVVPSNEPAPAFSQRLTGLLAGSPTADLLPYVSQVQTRGGGVKSVATVPLDGWFAKNNWV